MLSVVLGLFLLVTAGLKIHGLYTDPYAQESILLTPRLLVAVIEIEIVLGLWLLSGLASRAAWLAALVFFSLGAAANLYLALEGQRSCGCFGKLSMSPSLTVGLDVLAAAILLVFYPRHLAAAPLPRLFAASLASRQSALAWQFVGALVLMTGIVSSVWLSPANDAFANVSLEPASFDFGEALQGQRLVKAFRLTNGDERPIKIVKVHSTCGCSSTESVIGAIIDPSQTLDLPVFLETGASDGVRSSTLTVFYQAADSHTVGWKSLEVRARVVTDYWVRPLLVDFGKIEFDDTVARTLRIRPHYMKDLQLVRIETGHPAISARAISAEQSNGDICVEVTLDASILNSSGLVCVPIKLHTTSPRVPTTDVLVQAICQAPVDINPQAIVIGSDVRGEISRRVTIATQQPHRVGALRIVPSGLRANAQTADDTHTHAVTLIIPEPEEGHGLEGKVEVELDNLMTADSPRRIVTVPVYRFPQPKEALP